MVYKDKKPFFCTHCHGIFSRSFSLKRHTCIETMRVHNPDQKSYRSVLNVGPDLFQTQKRGELSTAVPMLVKNPSTLKQLMRLHSHWEKAVLLYRMHCCFQTGQSSENAHEKSHRWKNALCLYTVSQCDLLSHQPNHLKDCLRMHTLERPFSCKECGDSFWTSFLSSSHIKVVYRSQGNQALLL